MIYIRSQINFIIDRARIIRKCLFVNVKVGHLLDKEVLMLAKPSKKREALHANTLDKSHHIQLLHYGFVRLSEHPFVLAARHEVVQKLCKIKRFALYWLLSLKLILESLHYDVFVQYG